MVADLLFLPQQNKWITILIEHEKLFLLIYMMNPLSR